MAKTIKGLKVQPYHSEFHVLGLKNYVLGLKLLQIKANQRTVLGFSIQNVLVFLGVRHTPAGFCFQHQNNLKETKQPPDYPGSLSVAN